MIPSTAVLDRLATILRSNLPPGVTPAYFDGFLRRNRPALIAVLDRQLAQRTQNCAPEREAPPAMDEFRTLGVHFVSLREKVDAHGQGDVPDLFRDKRA